MEEKQQMEQFLKDKYGKEFVVESIDYYRVQLGGDKRIKAIVYPADNKEIKFDVIKLLNGKKWASDDSEYSDTYLNYLWDYQSKEKVEKVFDADFLWAGVSAPLVDIEKDIYGRTLDLDEALELYKKDISLYIRCGYFIGKDTGELDLSQLEKMYSNIESIKKYFDNISLVIRYFNEEYKNDIEKDTEKYLEAYASDFIDLKQKNIILFNVEIENLSDINQLVDLEKYIEK